MTLSPALPLILVATGLVLLGVVAYLAHLVRLHRRSLGSLLAQINLDPLQLPRTAWPALASGGLARLEYTGNWFGQAVEDNLGDEQNSSPSFTFQVLANNDVQLDFRLYAGTKHGETRLFAENLAGVFRLLMETAVHRKMETLSVALTEQARLTLYLQHDLRNLAQWVGWLATDFATATDEAQLLVIAKRLKNSAPHAALRAKHILDATCKTPSDTPAAAYSLATIIQEAADHAGISVRIVQDAQVFSRRELLNRTLDNLFTNVAPLLRLHTDLSIGVTITHEAGKVNACINLPRLAEISQLPPENLFEPFSSGRPGGLGLGLYQAHKSLLEAGGDLTAEICDDHICFLLTLNSAEF